MTAVTVLMPVYNSARYLKPAVEGVLAQTHGEFELLAMDDGSTDETAQILAGYADPRIRVVKNPVNMGLSATLNRGLREARHELIARHDGDDISAPTRLARQVAFLDEHADHALVGTYASMIDPDDKPLPGTLRSCREYVAIRWAHLFRNAFVHSSVMFRRSVILDRLGGYDEACTYDRRSHPRSCEDFDLWSRVMGIARVANLPERLVTYRVYSMPSETETGEAGSVPAQIRRVITTGLDRALGVDDPAPEMVALHFPLAAQLSPQNAQRFVAYFSDLVRSYHARHPDAGESRELRQLVARQYAQICRKIWDFDPKLARKTWRQAVGKFGTRELLALPLRILAKTVLRRRSRASPALGSPQQ